METVSENLCFGGVQGVYSHASEACGCDMTFGLYLPPAAKDRPVPVLWYLSGLTCTHENAITKAAAQGFAAEAGMAVVFPDTSPRGEGVADDEAYDLGKGAGFYVNATQDPWAPHFQMWDYVATELPALLGAEFAIDLDRQAITGHSMGGHGALTLAMAFRGGLRRYRPLRRLPIRAKAIGVASSCRRIWGPMKAHGPGMMRRFRCRRSGLMGPCWWIRADRISF